jgi:hypothetical protein
MTPYFRSYVANFNRIRLLELIDYRELSRPDREVRRSFIHTAPEQQIHEADWTMTIGQHAARQR